MEQTEVAELQNGLAHFIGSQEFTRLGPVFPGVIMSEGVLFLAEKAGAFWLPDAIASHIVTNASLREECQGLIFWHLQVENGSAVLTARKDSGLPALVTQEIEYTDFPLDEIEIWAGDNGEGYTLYLPSEH
jgi:hypothetical protein